MDFRDRHVVVTGGTGALGAAVVAILLANGAICHVPFYVEAEERSYVHRAHARVKLVSGSNITSQTVVERIYEGVPKLWASIHLAGGYAASSVAETDEVELISMVRTNLVTSFLCCSAAIKRMKRNGGGRIVNVSARPALEPRLGAGSVAYAASKGGVAVMTQAMAAEVIVDNILVNAVAPSVMDTPSNRQAMPKADYATWPKIEEVAMVICQLASPENKITSGAIVPVYGRA